MKCLHVNKTATSYREKMKICCIIKNLTSIKTLIHRKTIEGLHDIFRFFCFTLEKNLSLLNCTFSYTQHDVVLTEISGRDIRGIIDFSDQFRKIMRYECIGYNLNVM